jgi:Tfp pilus assembly protein PilX
MFKLINMKKDEKGFASIVVALTIIIVMALLTVAFAQLARREQQSSLDKQLAIQAYYAAESGINDTVQALGSISTSNDPNKCIDTTLLPNKTVSSATGSSYSCVLVNKQPPELKFGSVSPDNGRYSTFTTSDTLDTMTIEWKSADGNNNFTPNLSTKFPSKANWNNGANQYAAVVQFTLDPIPTSGLSRGQMIDNAFTVYLYPSIIAGGAVTYSPGNNGQIMSGGCTNANTYPCKVTIDGLNSDHYILHVRTFYDSSTDIKVTGSNNSSGKTTITDQAVIDVTGKARNVLKRLQVVVQTKTNGTVSDLPALPDNALEGQNICKRIRTDPVTGTSFDTITTNGVNVCRLDN